VWKFVEHNPRGHEHIVFAVRNMAYLQAFYQRFIRGNQRERHPAEPQHVSHNLRHNRRRRVETARRPYSESRSVLLPQRGPEWWWLDVDVRSAPVSRLARRRVGGGASATSESGAGQAAGITHMTDDGGACGGAGVFSVLSWERKIRTHNVIWIAVTRALVIASFGPEPQGPEPGLLSTCVFCDTGAGNLGKWGL
jgi:hypothetical protein